MLKRLDRSSAVKPVLEQFRDAIEEGMWPLGSQIPTENELVDMLGVGRGVVREALATLKAFGLIDSTPGRGTFVTCTPSELATWIVAIGSDNRELLEARYGIDAWINYLAAQKATPEDMERIWVLVEQMERAVAENKTRDEIVAIDGEFHDAMANATHNSVLARLSVIMAASLEHSRRANISTTDLLDEAIRSHRELAKAVEAHDPAGAWAATRRSLQRVARMQSIEIDVDDEYAMEERDKVRADVGDGRQ
jgi:GntR family transcriptional repressor for pyruvate dehydrogenase complex